MLFKKRKFTETVEQSWKQWASCLLILLTVFFTGVVIQIPGAGDSFEYKKAILIIGIMTVLLVRNIRFTSNFVLFSAFYVAMFVLSSFIPLLHGGIITRKEIASSFLFGTNWLILWTWIFTLSTRIFSGKISTFLCLVSNAARVLGFLLPLLSLGYTLVSGGYILSSSIILTLFQTNISESMAYLEGQNPWLWGIGCTTFIIIMTFMYKLMNKSERNSRMTCCERTAAILSVLLLLGSTTVVKRVSAYAPIRIVNETRDALEQYRAYGQDRVEREQRLKTLKGLQIGSQGGVYVLVIGESETRDHMQVYGYKRETTPWLTQEKNNGQALFFTNAYSNHTHTVPVLTYALSEKNQYNHVDLKNSYSLIEVAKAAGYDTYWISNQRKFGAWDTPFAEIGSTAAHQVWLNERAGTNDCSTDYYDSKLTSQIPKPNGHHNVLVVIHLMGCHGKYSDRFPADCTCFKGKSSVDSYDNAVRYNDHVLQEIYQKFSTNPDFKGMVYFSDHGDDVDRDLGHEAIKFTWRMSHIPLVVWLSDSFKSERPDIYNTLYERQNTYWTNDLVYNLMIQLMGINGAPGMDKKIDLTAPGYAMNRSNLMTLHGEKKLSEEHI